MNIADLYYKKTVDFNFKKLNLRFDVSQSLFSSQDVDAGTKRLLRTFTDDEEIINKKILDLGCGYGPIGIALGKFSTSNEVTLTDKDALAISFTNRNILQNEVWNCIAYPSLGYDDVKSHDYDLIVSNIPAKIGEKVLKHMLIDAENYLQPEGKVAVVVIDAINETVYNILNNPEKIKILKTNSWNGHVVYHYQYIGSKNFEESSNSSFDRGDYDRFIFKLNYNNEEFTIKTTYNLPEFDSLNIESKLILSGLKNLANKKVKEILIYGTGQGQIAVASSKLFIPEKIELVDRDIQALRISKENLISNNFLDQSITLYHEIDLNTKSQSKPDFIIVRLNEDDDQKVNFGIIDRIAKITSPNCTILIASSSTVITRIEKNIAVHKNLSKIDRKKQKGKSLLVLKGL